MPRRGFTLTELLVVVLIVTLVSAVALPTVLPALNNRQIGESARILQAAIAGARDAAIKANAPRGIRLLPDKLLSGGVINTTTGLLMPGQTLTASRIIPIEPAPDLTDSSVNGSATFHTSFVGNPNLNNGIPSASWANGNPPIFPFPPVVAPANRGFYPIPDMTMIATNSFAASTRVLMVVQSVITQNGKGLQASSNPPTNWFWNVRIGDKIRFNDSGHFYTIVGPMTIANPESFVNDGLPGTTGSFSDNYGPSLVTGNLITVQPEYLFLVNGVDDDHDGFTDPGVDGVNESVQLSLYPDFITDWIEPETWLGAQGQTATAAENTAYGFPPCFTWTISRRPVPSPGAREVSLPGGATIDMTTWDTTQERSRLPVDAYSGAVDILVDPSGRVIPNTYYSTPSSVQMGAAFYHFWITDTRDVYNAAGTTFPSLPISSSYAGTMPTAAPYATTFLKYDRMLLTLFARNGAVVTNSIENFNVADVNRPYDDAQLGTREAK